MPKALKVSFIPVKRIQISQQRLKTAVGIVAVEEYSEEDFDIVQGHEYVPYCTQKEPLVTSQLLFVWKTV